jgi:putative transposase
MRRSDGRPFRTLTIVDLFTKLSPAIEVDTSISGERLTRVLDRATELHGQPKVIVVDNGPQFRSEAPTPRRCRGRSRARPCELSACGHPSSS